MENEKREQGSDKCSYQICSGTDRHTEMLERKVEKKMEECYTSKTGNMGKSKIQLSATGEPALDGRSPKHF
ncbi:hypothetical protein JW824_01660 [bacterium]|nr:hypothetical protein [bacterium]